MNYKKIYFIILYNEKFELIDFKWRMPNSKKNIQNKLVKYYNKKLLVIYTYINKLNTENIYLNKQILNKRKELEKIKCFMKSPLIKHLVKCNNSNIENINKLIKKNEEIITEKWQVYDNMYIIRKVINNNNTDKHKLDLIYSFIKDKI